MPEYAHGYDLMTDAELLVKVKKGWVCKETPCGAGSTIDNSIYVRSALQSIFSRYDIGSVVDAGAGDLNWARLVDWDDYQGFDLYPRHEDVKQLDITKEVLPKSDLILCRHVLNHLSIEYAQRALDRFKQSGSKYLLMTMCDNQRGYWDHYGLKTSDPVETFTDCQHWRLELYHFDTLSA